MSWIGDESGNVIVEGSTVRHGGASGPEKKGNAMYDGGEDISGVSSWEFEVTGGKGMWVGLGTKENFGSGYKMKGLLYGGPGNLSDGGALLQGNWGPRFGEGDKVGLQLDVSGGSTSVAISKNGEGLGLAFDLHGWSGGAALRPIVSLDSPGQSVTISELAPAAMGSFNRSAGTPSGLAGSWCQENLCTVTLEPAGSPGQWKVGAKVANSMSCMVTEQEGGKVSAGPVMSTKMMPPPELREKEQSVSQLLTGLTEMCREGEGLRLKAGERSELFSVVTGGVKAVTREMVRWIK